MKIFAVFLLALLLSGSGCMPKPTPDRSLIPTEELKIDPQAMKECKKPESQPEVDKTESETLSLFAYFLNLLDECSDKHQVLVNAIKSVNTNTNKPQPGVNQ